MTADELKRADPHASRTFPSPGILFRDITTLIAHGEGFAADDRRCWPSARRRCGPEPSPASRRAASSSARRRRHGLGLGFVPVRKAGKLPVRGARRRLCARIRQRPARDRPRRDCRRRSACCCRRPDRHRRHRARRGASASRRRARSSSTRCSSSTCPTSAAPTRCAAPVWHAMP